MARTASITYPDSQWEHIPPNQANINPESLAAARQWLDSHVESYRFVIVRGGRIVVEWNRGLGPEEMPQIASAAKSIYSNILGVAIAEGKLPSADARVYDYYPEMMDVPEGTGPKPGRFARPKDQEITFHQLISNTSGYLKPGEEPGKVFNYQTFGMNILTHALAKLFGYYSTDDPLGSPGFGKLIDEKLAAPIGAAWRYSLANFDLPEQARLNIFGYYCNVHSTSLDLARLGWLWCNWGRWKDKLVVPESWLRDSVRTAPEILAHCPEEQWHYGRGFWTNDQGRLWPGLSRDGFMASGAGGHYIVVFPGLDLVIVQNPGLYAGPNGRGNPELLKLIVDANRV